MATGMVVMPVADSRMRERPAARVDVRLLDCDGDFGEDVDSGATFVLARNDEVCVLELIGLGVRDEVIPSGREGDVAELVPLASAGDDTQMRQVELAPENAWCEVGGVVLIGSAVKPAEGASHACSGGLQALLGFAELADGGLQALLAFAELADGGTPGAAGLR